jgi:hypothetical protein
VARLPDFTSLGQTPAPQTPLSVARVETQPLEFNVRQGPGEAAIRGGQQITHAGIQMQDRIDTLHAEDAYNKLLQTRTELESSPESGFSIVKGSAAIDRKFYDDYSKRFADATTGIAGTLPTGQSKQLFMNRAQVASAQYQSALLSHMSQQTSAFADNTEKTSVKLEVANASNAPNDAVFDTSLSRIRGILDARGSRLHQPPAETELDKLHAVDSAWTERIHVLSNNDPLAAQKMYEANKDKIGPDNKVVLEHQLHQLVLPVQAKNLALSVIAGAKPEDVVKAVTVGGDNVLNGIVTAQDRIGEGLPRTKVDTKANLYQWIADADEAAQRIKPNDPVFRDLVVQQVKGYVGTLVAAQDGVSRAAHGLLTSAAMGDGTSKPMTLDDLLTTPDLHAAWAVTTPEAQRGILAMLDHNTRGTPIKADARTVEMLFSRIHLPVGDPNRITSPTQVTPYFAKGVNEAYYKFLKDEIAQQQTDEGRNLTTTRENYLHGIKGQFSTSSMMNVDAQGDERFNNFRTFVLGEEAKAVKEGKVNPFDLYNYKSPNYISNKIPSFQASLDEQIRHLSNMVRQTVPPAKGAPAPPAPAPSVPQMTATNPTTNEKLISTDGGKTWQKP